MNKLSEFVSPGHPDKVADAISQYILDRYIEQDPDVRYAVEVMVKGLNVYLAGEITSTVDLRGDMLRFVREALIEIGYTMEYAEKWGLDHVINPEGITVHIDISSQSPEISQGVNNNGYGDQGIFFGYADVNGDEYMMPKSHSLAKNLCHMLYTQAKEKGVGGLDIKTEIILDGDNWITKIIAAVPCRNDSEYDAVKKSIEKWYEEHNVDDLPFDPDIILNGTGNYTMHGPVADSGVTGRKLAVDFYGGEFQLGGGAVIKDGTKADVSLNLYARKLAREWAKKTGQSIKVSLGCCIGKSEVDYTIETPCGDIIETGRKDLKPKELITNLGLDKPIYFSMHKFGLFGEYQQDKEWENIDNE